MKLTLSFLRSRLFLIIAVLFLALAWQLFWTSGIEFFWEDFDVFHIYWDDGFQLSEFSTKYTQGAVPANRLHILGGMISTYAHHFFSKDRLFQVGFNAYSLADRPYQLLAWDVMKFIFGKQYLFYRIFKAFFFAVNCIFIFLITKRLSNMLSLVALLLYATSSEIWLSAIYLSHLGLIAQCCVLISVFIFLRLLRKDCVTTSELILSYVLIFALSNHGILTIGDGRYLAVIFFATLLFFKRRYLLYHLPFLLFLFIMEFPILGYIKKMVSDGAFNPINLASHGDSTPPSLLSTIYSASRHSMFPFKALGGYLLLLVCLLIGVHTLLAVRHLFLRAFRNQALKNGNGNSGQRYVHQATFLFFAWFASAFFMSMRARGFRYGVGEYNMQLYDLAYFVVPFILCVCHLLVLTINRLHGNIKRILFVVAVCLVFVQASCNVIRLNRFRGGWGNYFCSWQNARNHIDKMANNGLVLAFMRNHYKPFTFINSHNTITITQQSSQKSKFCDLEYIESQLQAGYDQVFVIGEGAYDFRGTSDVVCQQTTQHIDGNSGDAYDRFKQCFGRRSKKVVNLYQFSLCEGGME